MELSESQTFARGSQAPRQRSNRSRAEVVETLALLDDGKEQGTSARAVLRQTDVPRSTALHWDKLRHQKHEDVLPGSLRQVFDTPDGLGFLHCLVVAILFVIRMRAGGGIREVCEVLELSGLSEVVASSYGTMWNKDVEMERELAQYERHQRAELSAQMTARAISLCQDETFHPEPCLVAIEPVSNYIVVEQYEEKRDAATWMGALSGALSGIPVTVQQVTSDQAKALIKEAEQLGVPHSPDLFHPQNDLVRATSRPLSARMRNAEEVYASAAGHKAKLLRKREFGERLEQAEYEEQEKKKAYELARKDREAVSKAIRDISAIYHPYELEEGRIQSPEEVELRLQHAFDIIVEVATRVGLSQRSHKRIEKARRVVDEMVKTIRFVHTYTTMRIAELKLTDEQRSWVLQDLIPGLYLTRVAGKAPSAEARRNCMDVANTRLAPLCAPEHPLRQQLDTQQLEQIDTAAQDCADIFQRSSSCVEGRNGLLSLFHHGVHKLSPSKLSAMTVVHNFHITRPDGSTAAERFYGCRHDTPFLWLLEHMQWPAYPAKSRKRRVAENVFRLAG